MTDTAPVEATRPEATAQIQDFVHLVRLYLGDLDDETRDELTEGLVADMSDLVAERGLRHLPDPEEYADELRVAAGLPVRGPLEIGPRGRSAFDLAGLLLDRLRDRGERWASSGRRASAWGFVRSMQPVWWVGRAWVAVELFDLTLGGNPHHWLPSLYGQTVGAAVLGAAVLVSVQVGRRAWWPRRPQQRARARVALLAANLTLLAALGPVGHLVRDASYWQVVDPIDVASSRAAAATPQRTPVADQDAPVTVQARDRDRPICEIRAYDAAGDPIRVRLSDENGRRVAERCREAERTDRPQR